MHDLPAAPMARIAFVKLITRDLELMEAFYGAAFGLFRTDALSSPLMEEIILSGKKGPGIILYRWKDERSIELGSAHGPIGFSVADVDMSHAHAIAVGAIETRPPDNFGTTLRASFLTDPEGHQIELFCTSTNSGGVA